MEIDFSYFHCLKGEFEGEGLSNIELAGELVLALRNGMDYLVKISGSEANAEINYLSRIGVKRIVCPMIESPFAMRKYMLSASNRGFEQLGVTIETGIAVDNIKQILEAGMHLSEVTIGRSDLSASLGIHDVESPEVISRVKTVAKAAKEKGLVVIMGGGVSEKTRHFVESDAELRSLIDYVETRKAVITLNEFRKPEAIKAAIDLEVLLLKMREDSLSRTLSKVSERKEVLLKRIER